MQVRNTAEKAVTARFEPSYAPYFLANISLVLRLQACGRVDKRFVDNICNLLKRPECKDALLAGTTSKDKAVRRISFQLAAEADPTTRASIIRAVMTDPDAVARSWAVRRFLPDVTPDELPGIVEPMLKDRFMPVRREALWFLATKRPDVASQPLRSALLDSHISMRDTARHFLTLAGVDSARAFYIEAVRTSADKQRPTAIRGLGETGEKTDVELIATHLNSNSTKTRRAAAYAIGKLDTEGQLEKLTGALSDTKSSVSREALKALLPKARHVPLDDLEKMFANEADFHIRHNALALISHADKWKKVPALLKACADKEIRLAEQAAQALRAWSANYNSSFAEPTHEDFRKISRGLSQFETYLPNGFAAELRACLKIYFK